MTPAETLAKAKQLGRFLGKAVTDIKASDRTAMDRFSELAARSAQLRQAAEDRADKFAARLDAIPELLDRAFAPQETMLDDLERGAEVLENSLKSMIGDNGGPLEVSPPVAPPSPPVVPPVVELVPPPVPEPVVDATATGNPPA